jgi:GT2 family glycosyltransferase
MSAWDTLDPRLDPYLDEDNPARIGQIRQPNSPSTVAAPRPRRRGLSVIILTLDKPELIIPLVTDLQALAASFAAAGLGYEVLIGDTGSTDPQVLAFYEDVEGDVVRVVRGLKYQFSRCNNQVFFGHARFDKALFLNNDVVIADNPGCLLTMASHLEAQPEVGIAGLCLYFADRRVQHIGIDFFRGGPLHGFCYHPHAGTLRPPERLPSAAEVPAVTGACLMMQAALFERLGGFDETYRTECQDVALCLAARRLGWRTHLVQAGWILHLENATRPKGSEDWGDRRRFLRKWNAFVEAAFPQAVVQ